MAVQPVLGNYVTPNLYGPYYNAGAPNNGASEVQTITVNYTPTGGTFALTFDGWTTAPIAYNAAASVVQAALRLLPNIGTTGVTCAGGALPGTPVTCAFAGPLANRDVPQMTVNGALLTGGTPGTIAISTSTPGVTGTARGALAGAVLYDTTNGIAYENTGTQSAPVWTQQQSSATSGTTVKVALAALDTAGGVLSWLNPTGVAIIVSKVILDVTTKSTGACTLDVGTTVVSATTKVDNLADGLDVGTAAGLFGLADQAGANGKAQAKLAAGGWVTASMDSGAAAGLVGSAYISFHPA